MRHNADKHEWIIAPYKQDRENARTMNEIYSYQIDCHRNHRGPYTGAVTLLRLIVPVEYQRRPAFVLNHAITILSVAPELKTLIPMSQELSMSFTAARIEDAFYPHSRTLHLAHGLVDFLLESFAQEELHTYSISFENVHMADPLDQEFIAILLRRAKSAHLYLSIGTSSNLLPEPLMSALHSYAQILQPQPMTRFERQEFLSSWKFPDSWAEWLLQHTDGWQGEWRIWQPLLQEFDLRWVEAETSSLEEFLCNLIKQLSPVQQCALARIYVGSDCTSDDLLVRAAYSLLEPTLRQQLHKDRVAELEKDEQSSFRFGAIPYHYIHSISEEQNKQGAQSFLSACESCLVLGFYEASLDLGLKGRKVINRKTQSEQHWLFTKAAIISYLLLGNFSEVKNLCSETRAQVSDPAILMNCAYFMAIMYSRFYEDGKRDYQLARKWIQEAIEYAEACSEPDRMAVNFLEKNTWAFTELRLGRPKEALRLLSEGLQWVEVEMRGHDRYPRELAILLQNRAQLYTRSGLLEQAFQDYTTLIELGLFVSEHYFHRANVLLRLGRYPEALEDFNSAITWAPPYPEVYFNRAHLFAVSGHHDRALADYTRTLELDPNFVAALVSRASLLYSQGEYLAARKDVERGLALKPDNAQLLCIHGLLEIEANRPQEAHSIFSLAIEKDPTQIVAWINRATLLFEEGKTDAAIEDLTQVLRLKEDATALYNRALAYQTKKQWKEAIDDYSRVLALSGDDRQRVLAQRNQCYQALKNAE